MVFREGDAIRGSIFVKVVRDIAEVSAYLLMKNVKMKILEVY
ncbi:MAG: hypothetical protein RR486_16265 [Clostridium sp.]